MAQKNISLVGATVSQLQLFEVARDGVGDVVFRVDAAAPGQVLSDVQTIGIADTSLTAAQKAALSDIVDTVLSDVQAREGYV